jgi:hypothetical protein
VIEAWNYRLFGLSLQADRAIAGLTELSEPAAAEVEFHLGGFPEWARHLSHSEKVLFYQSEGGLRLWRLAGGKYLHLKFQDDCEFVIDGAGTSLWAAYPPEVTPEYLGTYLLGPVVGLLLRLRGTICLHASAIAVNNQAIALVGPAGAGKSTTATAFARIGFPVLTDDITALKEEDRVFLVLPGDPNLCLWPQAVTYLFGSPDALPLVMPENPLAPDWDKRNLDLTSEGYRFQSQPLPLRAIYFLGERQKENAPRAEGLTGQAGLLSLLANAYGSRVLDRTRRGQEFDALSRLGVQVPLRRIFPHADPTYLTQTCELILDDFHALPILPSAPPSSYTELQSK